MTASVIEERHVALNSLNTLVIPNRVTPIYPVRYAYANFFAESLQPAAEPPALAQMLNKTNASQTNGYVVRLLRPGWIYIREESGSGGGHFHIFKYHKVEVNGQVEERFAKYLFTNGIDAQDGLKKDTSGAMKDGYPFAFVRKEVTDISIAYSEHEWHPNIIDSMNKSAAERADAMQRVKLQGDDAATVPATPENMAALVEDYRDRQSRLLALKTSSADPDVKNTALDVLTTEASYDLDADDIAAALRRRTKPGATSRIVALHDPVGRQREIAEIHVKLALWEKGYASENVYPFTIGHLVHQLNQSSNADLKDILKESINWKEFNQYWKSIDNDFKLFRDRQAQFANLYRAFMQEPALTGKPGSLDTYFKKFFCITGLTEKQTTEELEKLCDIAEGIFNGILSTDAGEGAITRLLEDHAKDHNAFSGFCDVLSKIITGAPANIEWAKSMEKFLLQLGPFWGKVMAASIYYSRLGKRATYRYSAEAIQYAVQQVLPAINRSMGIEIDVNKRARYNVARLSEILGKQLQASVNRYPHAPGTDILESANKQLKNAEKLFNWGERQKATNLPRYIELSQMVVLRSPGVRYAFVLPESVVGFASGAVDFGSVGLSLFLNVKSLYEVAFQSEFDSNDPLDKGNAGLETINLLTTLTSLVMDGMSISSNSLNISLASAAKASNQSIATLAPRLAKTADTLGKLLATKVATRVVVGLNLASAVTSVWSGVVSWKGDNRGEAAGHFMLAVGSLVVAAVTLVSVGGAAAKTGGGAALTGAGTVPGLIAGGIGLLLIGAGATLLWVYGKSGFQKILENCFWGNSKRYGFWDGEEKRPEIAKRMSMAKELGARKSIASAFKIELQEFSNYLNMPALEIENDFSYSQPLWHKRTYTMKFTLPRFQVGVSEIEYEVRTKHIDTDVWQKGWWRKHERLTKALQLAMDKAKFKEKNGMTTLTVQLDTTENIELFWAYKPQSDIVVPLRYLKEDGVVGEPVVGMINEEPI